MRTPVTLITGVEPNATEATMVSLLWDMPDAVAVHYRIDVVHRVLVRTVSDASGLVEHEEIVLEHVCSSCAIREDVIPTLERVSRDGRWASVLAHLPVGVRGDEICTLAGTDPRLARIMRISSVLVALRGPSIVKDLLGDDLLRERDLASSKEDNRGVGEVAASMVEYADVVVLHGETSATAADLVRALARPDAYLATGPEGVSTQSLAGTLHELARTRDWVDPQRTTALPGPSSTHVWTLDLRSERALHPQRLLHDLESLGGGHHRSRGCFWLPTRPDQCIVWDGAGGQLSIGTGSPWGPHHPMTRLVITGVGRPLGHLQAAFDRMLVSPDEVGPLHALHATSDGFETWLGPVRDDVA